MHEMSLCEGVVQVIEEQARLEKFSRVKTIWLEIGALAGVEIDAMLFSFEAVAKGSVAEDATLEIITQPGLATCVSCCHTVEISARFDACPDCGGYPLEIISGEAMRIKELEVE